MNRLRVAVVLSVFMLPSGIFAQEDQRVSVSVFGSYTIPLGMYAEKIGDNASLTRRFGLTYGSEAGLATPGFAFGVEVLTGVLTPNLEWVISVQGIVNGVDNSEVEDLFEDEVDDSVDVSVENGHWIHIPVLTGLTYFVDLSTDLRIFGTLQAGINFTRQPYRRALVGGTPVEETTFTFAFDFGFAAGIGIEFLRSFQVGARYYGLDTPSYQGTRTLNPNYFPSIPRLETQVSGDERSVSLIAIYVGYTL
jgi:hypothetical protein